MAWNVKSLDGLHGLRAARRDLRQWLWLEDAKARVRRVMALKEALIVGIVIGVLLALLPRIGQVFLEGGRICVGESGWLTHRG